LSIAAEMAGPQPLLPDGGKEVSEHTAKVESKWRNRH
jgi:hypothetical protein